MAGCQTPFTPKTHRHLFYLYSLLLLHTGNWTDGAHSLLRCSLSTHSTADTTQPRHTQQPLYPSDATASIHPASDPHNHHPQPIISCPAPPLSEQGIAQLRHSARRASLLLNPPGSFPPAWLEGEGGEHQGQQHNQQQHYSQQQLSCPILLVRRQYGAALSGWSLVLPAGWVMPFWSALSFTGESCL